MMRDLEELRNDTTNEEEARKLKRQKQDLENRLREQAEEIDELTGQVQVKSIKHKLFCFFICLIHMNLSDLIMKLTLLGLGVS